MVGGTGWPKKDFFPLSLPPTYQIFSSFQRPPPNSCQWGISPVEKRVKEKEKQPYFLLGGWKSTLFSFSSLSFSTVSRRRSQNQYLGW